MKAKETLIIKQEAKWGRSAYLKIEDDRVVFDTSDGEYGPITFHLEQLEEALLIHKAKCTPSTLDTNI